MKRKANFPISSYSDLLKIQKTDTKKADITTSNFNYSAMRQQQQKQAPQISYANLRKNVSTSIPATQVPQQQQFSSRPPTSKPPSSLSKTLETLREKGETQIPLKMDANQILHKIPLAGHLKVMLDPDLEKLKRYAKRKQLLKHHRDKLIKAGKIKPILKNNKANETLKVEDQQEVHIRMNEKGELRDDKGNLIKLDQNRFNLRINKKQKQQDKYKQMIKLAQQNSIRHTLIYDKNVTISSTTNKKLKQKSHALHFLEKKNRIQSESVPENTLSNEVMDLETFLQKTFMADENITNNDDSVQQKRISLRVKHHDPIPSVEWWDLPLFRDQDPQITNSYFKQYDEELYKNDEHEQNIDVIQNTIFSSQFYEEKNINNLVEHPEGFKSPFNHTNNTIIPFFLTTKERKKIKRKRKMDKQRDMTDKLKLGLIEPPPPKVKLSNMLNVFQTDAVSDPSKIEQEVRSQIQARLFKHLQSNAARKLNSEQKYDKTVKKLKKDSAQEIRVALFRIENLQHGQQRFKVDKNAQTLQMHGVCLIPSYEDGFNCPIVLVVEGGPKAIKRYKKLLLFRIKWDQGALNDDEEQKKINLEKNKCELVWEGVIKEHGFKQWKVQDIKNEMEGKRALSERNVEYYWDKVMNKE